MIINFKYMKKFIFPFLAISLFSCSDNKNEEVVNDDLVPVSIVASSDMDAQTRALWGDELSDHTIPVTFESGESFSMHEKGYENDEHKEVRSFVNSDAQGYQSGNFSGKWHSQGKDYATVLPPANVGNVVFGTETVTYNLLLPNEQTTRISSYDDTFGTTHNTFFPAQNSNIMIGAQHEHSKTCFFAPTVAYLRFYTNNNVHVITIKSNGEGLVGPYTIVTNKTRNDGGVDWDSWQGYVEANPTLSKQGASKQVTITGQEYKRLIGDNVVTYNEFVVCILPGTYSSLEFYAGNSTNESQLLRKTNEITCAAVNLYYLGKVNKE